LLQLVSGPACLLVAPFVVRDLQSVEVCCVQLAP